LNLTEGKTPEQSCTIMNELVLPNDTNTLNSLMGGRLLHWMDICAAIAGQRHAGKTVVTASVDSVSFGKSIRLGDLVTLEARVTRAFNTSMEIYIVVHAESIPTGEKFRSNEAYFTFVALDTNGVPVKVPQLIPQSEADKKRYDGALRRRQLRLILGGKMKPADATELKALFVPED
jgi:acyl-CoA hydrolase